MQAERQLHVANRRGRRLPWLATTAVVVASVVAAACSVGGASPASPGASVANTSPAAVTGGNITTYDYNNTRSGVAPVAGSISSLSFAWKDSSSSHRLDGAVYAEPLVYDGLLVVVTENDTIYGIDARTGTVRWHRHIGTPIPAALLPCGDVFPLGITSTPVIDPATNEVFAVGEVQRKSGTRTVVEHLLVALSLKSGSLRFERPVDPPGNGKSYDVAAEQQRAGLTLANGKVYVPFGGLYGDCGNYHGYVVDVPVSGTGALQSYQVPTQREGAIWETNGAVVGPDGDLYVATGNGQSQTSFDHGNSVIELSPGLKAKGYFAPRDWAQLSAGDLDLGSAGPIHVPGTDLLFEEGKANENGIGVGYLLTEGRLGGIGHPAFKGTGCPGGQYVFGANAAAVINKTTYVFVACSGGTEALKVTAGSHPSFKQAWSPSSCGPNGPPIVAGGLVWSIDTGSNVLCGMSPTTGRVKVTKQLDQVEHFATAAVADGMLFVPTSSGVEAFHT